MTKADFEASHLWGTAYAKIPKSVFATVAYHLADLCSEKGYGNGQAINRFLEEVAALAQNDFIGDAQAKTVKRALTR